MIPRIEGPISPKVMSVLVTGGWPGMGEAPGAIGGRLYCLLGVL